MFVIVILFHELGYNIYVLCHYKPGRFTALIVKMCGVVSGGLLNEVSSAGKQSYCGNQ